MENVNLEIIEYLPEHQPWFERFNRQWIEEFFWMEPIDVETLQDPDEYIISKGGKILVALYDKEIAGTVALKYVDDSTYEFTKMAVDSKFRGLKVGQALGEAAITKARDLGAKKIILYSHTVLVPAVTLYKKLGFNEVPVDGPYRRSNVKMELEI